MTKQSRLAQPSAHTQVPEEHVGELFNNAQLEGFARGLGRLLDIPAPDYSTFSIRIPQLKLNPYPKVDASKPVTLAIDSSGLKLTQGGQWHLLPIARIKRKEWVKMVLLNKSFASIRK